MPEGDTIFRAACTLRAVLENRRIDAATSQDPAIRADALIGQTVTSVEARGKHLLLHLDSHSAIHSHMGMTGSWHIYSTGAAWRKPQSKASLVLSVERTEVVCFSPKTLEILSTDALRRHRFLTNLGPDLLKNPFPEEEALQRFRQCGRLTLGDAVMHQGIVCGVGNVYKSEGLFLTNMSPFQVVDEFSDEQLLDLLKELRGLMRRNLQGFRRRTRFAADGSSLWVYSRSGEPCLKCGQLIRMQRQGNLGRSTYWCPTCQTLETSAVP